MKADYRFGMLAFAAGLSLGSPALAQSIPQNTDQSAPPPTIRIAPPPPTTAPSRDTIGPRELQNFNLGGTAAPPSETAPTGTAPVPSASRRSASPSAEAAPAAAPPTSRGPARGGRAVTRRGITAPLQAAPAATPDLSATTAPPPVEAPSTSPPAATFAPAPETATPTLAPPPQRSSMVPWLLAAVVLAAGIGFLLWRRRPREAFAGGAEFDSYAAPEPAPAPPPVIPKVAAPPPAAPVLTPAPAPAPAVPAGTIRAFASAPAVPVEGAPAPAPAGIVSTRLRPWLDVNVTPMTCQIQGEHVTFEFEVEVFNSGAGPARDVQVSATLFNAGPTQDRDIAAFMAQPVPDGEALPPIAPLQRVAFRTALDVQRSSLQLFEAGGRQLFVPVLAYSARYRWGGGAGQTAGSYLLGRDTGAEKLAPLRADAGPRAFGGLGVRLLPTALRN